MFTVRYGAFSPINVAKMALAIFHLETDLEKALVPT